MNLTEKEYLDNLMEFHGISAVLHHINQFADRKIESTDEPNQMQAWALVADRTYEVALEVARLEKDYIG